MEKARHELRQPGAGRVSAGRAPEPGEDSCPLCAARRMLPWHRDRRRQFLRCPECALVFVPRSEHLEPAEERRRYDQHRNDPADFAYRRFLSALYRPLIERLAAGAEGLDFGSGPGPTLSVMLEEAGHPMSLYDPFYAPGRSVLESRYDFVTCTEAVEHFARPGREWQRLVGMLRPGGWLGIMTSLLEAGNDFTSWHYKDDPTHVCFYSRKSIDWLAERYHLRLQLFGSAVILLQRS